MRRVGVLSVQGAFAEMAAHWRAQGAATFEIRRRADLAHPMDLLALPGGESTVQGQLLKDLGLFDPLRRRIAEGLPTFATCAGLILLARTVEGAARPWFGLLPVTVRRNAYGRQLGSFTTVGTWDGRPGTRMVFIRAPSITAADADVDVLSTFDGRPTSVRWRNITAFTWHPELAPPVRPAPRPVAGTGGM